MSVFDNEVAIITGSAQGIGFGIASTLAADGATVVITDINETAAQRAADELIARGLNAWSIGQNVLEPDSMNAAIQQVKSRFGRFDILVNNAGIASQQTIFQVTEDNWDRTNDLNSKAVFFSCQAAGEHFRDQGGGKIVNVASMNGKVAIPEYVSYNASKFSVIGITQTVALELAPFNVNVNAVCPGIVRTPMWDELPAEQWEAQCARIPLKRGQTPEDIGHAVSFLASDTARNITGSSLAVTGGLQMW